MAITWLACPFKCRVNSTVEFHVLDSDMQKLVATAVRTFNLPSHRAAVAPARSVLREPMLSAVGLHVPVCSEVS